MKTQVKGPLNTGAHFFVKDQRFTGRLIVQQKPIKRWGDYDTNELYEVQIKPTLLSLGDPEVQVYHNRPYLFYVNRTLQFAADSWQQALEYVEYRFGRVATPLGLGPFDLQKQFVKNEPRISFGEVHKILTKAGVVLE